jgi:uncharacterized LabA/DUF88 family protein
VSDTSSPQKRVKFYIDGFNLYFGMKESGWQRYYWLDVYKLAEILLPTNSLLLNVNYFTSRVTDSTGKRKRQGDYLEALATTKTQIIYGEYRAEPYTCYYCVQERQIFKEKMTDVNIAVEMMADAFADTFDIAVLISGDSDLTPPTAKIRQLFPEKEIHVGFPPKRKSRDLVNAAFRTFDIARMQLRDSQFPDEVTKADGYVLHRPDKWK